jgi:hypothetical protein
MVVLARSCRDADYGMVFEKRRPHYEPFILIAKGHLALTDFNCATTMPLAIRLPGLLTGRPPSLILGPKIDPNRPAGLLPRRRLSRDEARHLQSKSLRRR